MFISEPILNKILDAIEARMEKVLAKYGIKPVISEPNSVQDVLDFLPRKTVEQVMAENKQVRITEAE